jgi:Uma2 family endonuclease
MTTIMPPGFDFFQLAPPHQFSSAEYMDMINKGILGPQDKVELVGGFIVNMSPQGSRHNSFLMKLNRLFAPLHSRFFIAVQGTMAIAEGQIFDPDFMLLRQTPEGYKLKLPEPRDVCLVVEAAESSLHFDQRVKLPVYASAKISEYWIADLEREILIIHRQPTEGGYSSTEILKGTDIISPLAAPELAFAIRQAFE